MAQQPWEEDLFEQTGPYEPITTRIRNILREYKDGVGIFKELIQNADDAGASTVKFLVDWRQGQTRSLFSPGMAECQGPALWAYNNAVFTDKDFENINKLAGETKVEDLSKIGRFGLGFNAVYHLTDVPSFVSREYFVTFDPNTHHLQSHIKDKSRPGIRINLVEKRTSLARYGDQFQPYNGVFGCPTAQTQHRFHYNGTLFRFPFRTARQASTSDISKTAYGRDKVAAILRSLSECASTLLIFSQHVKDVEIYELDKSHQPDQMQLLLSVKKPSEKTVRSEVINRNEPFIKQCSKWWEQHRESQRLCSEYPSRCDVVSIATTKMPSGLTGCGRKHSSNETWLVVSASGANNSLSVARSPDGQSHGLLPCGGAACLQKTPPSRKSNGELFCFLPLSIPTGLPVHVNGYFAIMSNRVEIWKRTMMRSQPIEVTWNEALMEDALARVYIMLLEEKKKIHTADPHYRFYSLWPSCDDVDMKSWERLIQKVCGVLLEQRSQLFHSDGMWMSIDGGFILGVDFSPIDNTAKDVLRSLGIHMFDLPDKILKTLKRFDQTGIIQLRTLTFEAFMKQYFFPNIRRISSTQRDAIVCFGLDRILKGNKSLGKLFQQNSCIAASENGNVLVKPSQLIHPFGNAARLFSNEEQRFPVGEDLRDSNRLYVLVNLGMASELDWDEIYKRAQSIAKLGFHDGVRRSQELVAYLNKRVYQLEYNAHHRNLLQSVKFLPFLTRPGDEYPLPWKGSHSFAVFLSPKDLFLPKYAKLIGSSCYVVNTSSQGGCGKLNDEVEDLLEFDRLPQDKLVIQQLDEAIKFWHNLSIAKKKDASSWSAVESICQKIYEFFNDELSKWPRNQNFLNQLRYKRWLFLQGNFVESKKVAYRSHGDGAPYLFTLPSRYKRDYRHLFEEMQIKETFDDEDYISALNELRSTKSGNALTEDELQIALFFINQIDVEGSAVENHIGTIPLPDTDGILRPSKDVVVNLSLWLEDSGDSRKVHEKISPQTARALGATPLKNLILKNCSQTISYGVSFGQHEDLTDRLKGILEGYPADGILKELVQNADDTKASEIHFIHDTRTLESENVVTEKDKSDEIQGPALCVFNDRPFSDEDLDGITKLGVGSKQASPELTGKYGIGFNSVYHLTDCPSFLSDNETLVILDPHCRYVPEARPDGPGTKISLSTKEIIQDKIADTLKGYLREHFKLKGSTMFRFPLRRRFESKISDEPIDLSELLKTFKKEARESLLFLNHIKRITLSKIDPDNKLRQIYQVETVITPEDERKRQEIAQKICNLGNTPTAEIGWQGTSYTLKIKESTNEIEGWLIQQCIGSNTATFTPETDGDQTSCKIPNGRKLGLLPRGGLAARLWKKSSTSGNHEALSGIAYCFLPLPEGCTKLPVHVNGHFALDSTRRGLWTDRDGRGAKCEWNHFMKSCVLPQAYAALIMEAQKHLCNDKNDNQLSRYHSLFPTASANSPWKALTIGLYCYLGQTRAKVLPFLTPTPTPVEDEESTGILAQLPGSSWVSAFGGMVSRYLTPTATRERPVHVTRAGWLSVDQAYFTIFYCSGAVKVEVLHLLIRVGLPVLLHAPFRIHNGFRSARITSHEVTTRSVIDFLRRFNCAGSTCKIDQLPKKLQATVFKSVEELSMLIDYCKSDDHSSISMIHQSEDDDDSFGKHLEGIPLLLTQDGYLRVFDSRQPVFGSEFGDLFPKRNHSFVHSDVVHKFSWITAGSRENIIREFNVKDLAKLLPEVFADTILAKNEDHVLWIFPSEGILSENWFKRLWDFLQNHAKPERDETFVSLECLAAWPLIPTTCGKLVTIKNAKTVLDMTTAGTELTEQKTVRTFLSKLKCPVLNKEITFKREDKRPSSPSSNTHDAEEQSATRMATRRVLERKTAVTDPYVAHPHNVMDVLVVLHHLLMRNRLDISETDEHEIHDFLRFVQNNYEVSERLGDYEQIIKLLPFHKRIDGQFVSMTGQYSSFALVPSGVPTQQLDELQEEARCLFLNSDALPELAELYNDLGVKAGHNATQFYVEYVFRHFSMLTTESQIAHLNYIRTVVYAELPQGRSKDKTTFLTSMANTRCIPDEHGNLHYAREFYDPNNDVFKMFEDTRVKFPPAPFNGEVWYDLLVDIGLHDVVTPELFLIFCQAVAEAGRCSPSNQRNQERSRKLVEHLFSNNVLQENEFLTQLSKIKFIAPAKMDESLTSIHKQYQCMENGYPPFIKFSNAVPLLFRYVAWTTVPILPTWAVPNNVAKFNLQLRIAMSGPACDKVVEHLQNVVKSCENAGAPHDSSLLSEITKYIYKFLWKCSACYGPDPTEACSVVCMDIGVQLKDVPCIFLQDDKIFVKAEQLVFELPEDSPLKPFLYRVPREFGELEHFLKRLGATNSVSLFQIACVLQALHDRVGENILSPDEENKAKYSMYLLFELLYRGENADSIDELYLPSQNKRLVNSRELVCKVSSRFTDVIERLQRPVLLRFEECKLKKPSDDYINALPEHLRPKKFEDLVKETVDPECAVSVCSSAQEDSVCDFQRQFETLLQSEEFQEGLKRLLTHDKQDPRNFEGRLKALQTNVQSRCIGVGSVRIQIIDRDSDEVLDHLEDSCYAVQEEDSWSLYMQHEFKDDRSSIVSCINKILGNCIHEELALSAMLECSSPSDIRDKLNKKGITESLSSSVDGFAPPEGHFSAWDSRVDNGISRYDGHGKGPGAPGAPIGGYGIGHHGPGGGHLRDEEEDEMFYAVSHDEAIRWVKQSKNDLEGAKWLLKANPPFNALACFLSHQVAEKCLKAILFGKCGISGQLLGSHNVDHLGCKVREETEMPAESVQLVRRVANYYLPTRYPNRQPFNIVPAEAFNRNNAVTAVDAASRLLEIVENYLPQ